MLNNDDVYFNIYELFNQYEDKIAIRYDKDVVRLWKDAVGRYISDDYVASLKNFSKITVNHWNPVVIFIIGYMYSKGQGTPQNYEEADRFFQLARKEINSDLQLLIGKMYLYGQGVHKNNEKANELIFLSARNGNSDAENFLGYLYQHGIIVYRDLERAFGWYETSAKKGNPNGAIILGLLYRDGEGVEQNHIKSHMWFNLAQSSFTREGNDLHEKAKRLKEKVESTLSRKDINIAQAMAKEFYEKNKQTLKL